MILKNRKERRCTKCLDLIPKDAMYEVNLEYIKVMGKKERWEITLCSKCAIKKIEEDIEKLQHKTDSLLNKI